VTTNGDIAAILQGIADLLELQGVRFKPEAYRRAARSIEALPEDVRTIAARGGLDDIPAVGTAIAEKIREYLADGRIPYYDRLRAETPEGLLALVRLPGVGPKTARRFMVEFGIAGPAELGAALAAGRFRGVKGFGDRKIQALQEAVAEVPAPTARTTLRTAWLMANALVDALRAGAPVDRLEVAGSLRRRRESVGDLDILATSVEPDRVLAAFVALPDVATVRVRGPTKATVVVGSGLQVDLRVVEPAAFGAALQYFTGSKDHNVQLRTRARDRGLKVNEYGVYRDENRIAGATEEDVYAALGLRWIPPEIRENEGEIEAAAGGTLPTLVDRSDLTGDAHVHLEPGATPAAIDRRLEEAATISLAWIGLVVPDDAPELLDHLDHRRAAASGRAAARRAIEVPITSTAPVPTADAVILDASGAGHPPTRAPVGKRPWRIVGHLDRAKPASGPPAPTAEWVAWAVRHRIALEIGPDPGQTSLDATTVRALARASGPVHITAGVETATDPMNTITLALGVGRRGWLGPGTVINRTDPASRTPPA